MRRILISLAVGFGMAVALLGLLNARPAAAQGVIYVDQTATGSNDGLLWDSAYTDLQDALGAASAGDEIWVATGVYTPGLARIDTFTLTPGVALYGGFAGTETARDQRDWETNVTVLSGDIDGNDTNTDGNFIAEMTDDIAGANAYHVLWLDGVTGGPITETTVIDGFIITAGQADGGGQHSNGGGLSCDGAGTNNECSPTLANVTFSGNRAGTYGGGMYNDGRYDGVSSPTLTHVTFSGNRANGGGGMLNRGNESGESSPTLTNVTFSGNQAGYGGGGMFNDGNGSGSESSPILTNVLFSGNQADYGGGIYNYGAWNGGESSPSLTNVTFSGNQADNGGGMYNHGQSGASSPALTNVILWDNAASASGAQLYNHYATPVLSYTLIQSDANDIYNDNSTVTYGAGILTTDPQFVAPITATAAPTIAGNYRLQAGSPAINAGDNGAITVTTDLDGNPRISGGVVDLGAYEWTWFRIFLPLTLRNFGP